MIALPGFWESYTFTLAVAVAATALASVGAAGIGFALARRPAGQRAPRCSRCATTTSALPHLVWAVALVALLAPSGWVARLAAAVQLIERPEQFPVLVNDTRGVGIVLHLVTKELPFVVLATLPLVDSRLRAELAQTPHSVRRRARSSVTCSSRGSPRRSCRRSSWCSAYALGGYEPGAVLGAQRPRALAVVAVDWFRDPTLARRDDAFAATAILA